MQNRMKVVIVAVIALILAMLDLTTLTNKDVHLATINAKGGKASIESGNIVDSTGKSVDKNTRIINVMDAPFFAKGDGVADDTVAFQNFVAASANKTAYIPAGTYNLNSQITFPLNCTVLLDENAVLDFSSASGRFPDNACILARGDDFVSLSSLASDLTMGTKSMIFSTAPSVVQGDVLVLYNPVDYSYSGYRAMYRAGEYVVVDSVVGNTITLKSPLYDSYAANISVYKMSGGGFEINGGKIIGNSAVASVLLVERSSKFRMKNIICSNGKAQNILIKNCYDVLVDNVDSFLTSDPSIGINYAIQVANCQEVAITNSRMASTRHAISVGGGNYTGGVPNRNINISDSILKTTNTGNGVNALDFHGNAEHWSVINCITEGINVGGDFGVIANNQINGHANAIYMGELSGINFDIHNNKMQTVLIPGATFGSMIDVGGMANNYSASAKRGGMLKIQGNNYKFVGTGKIPSFYGIVFTNRGANFNLNLVIKDNDINIPAVSDVTGQAKAVYVKLVSGAIFDVVDISNNELYGAGIEVDRAKTLIIEKNKNRGVVTY